MIYYKKSPQKIINEIVKEKKLKLFLLEEDATVDFLKGQITSLAEFLGMTAQAATHLLSALGKFGFTIKSIINDEPVEYLKKNLRLTNSFRNSLESKLEKITPKIEPSIVNSALANIYLGGAPLGAVAINNLAGFLNKEFSEEGTLKDNLKKYFNQDRSHVNVVENLKELISDYVDYCDEYPSQKKTDNLKKIIEKYSKSLDDIKGKIEKNKDKIFKFYRSKEFKIGGDREEFLSLILFDGYELDLNTASKLLDHIYDHFNSNRGSTINNLDKKDKTSSGKTGSITIKFDTDYKDADELKNQIIKEIEIKRKDGDNLFVSIKKFLKNLEEGKIPLSQDVNNLLEKINETKNPYESFYNRLINLHENQREIRKLIEKRMSEKKETFDYLVRDFKKKIGTIMVKIKAKKDSYKGGSKIELCKAVDDIISIIDAAK